MVSSPGSTRIQTVHQATDQACKYRGVIPPKLLKTFSSLENLMVIGKSKPLFLFYFHQRMILLNEMWEQQ